MKISFITTLQTNVGDDFVREGIRAVLDETCAYQPYFINKHQADLTCAGPVAGDAARPIRDKILDADVVIQCGAPVYWNLGALAGQKCSNAEWIKPLWYDRIGKIYERKPILNVAAGACQGYFGSTSEITEDSECETFVRDIRCFCSLLTVRDRMAYEVNTSLGLAADLAPCTSILAWRRCWPSKHSSSLLGRGPIALNFMRLGGHYDLAVGFNAGEWRRRFREIARLLVEAGEDILPVAHSLEESSLLAELLPESQPFYSSNYLDYFPIYAACSGGVFNRVHGAMLLAGRGVPSVIIGNDSRTRMADELGLPRWHVSEAEPRAVVDRLLEMVRDEQVGTRLAEIERRSFDELLGHLRRVMPQEPEGGRTAIQHGKQSVLIFHSGGFGDLVLASGLVSSIKRSHADWHVTVACRARAASVSALYPIPADHVLAIDFDPYAWSAPSAALLDSLRGLVESLKRITVDTYLAAELHPTWFSWLLASVFRPRQAISCTSASEPSGFLSLLYEELGLRRAAVELVSPPDGTHELRRYELLLGHLQIPARFAFPWESGEKAGDYLVCFPLGSPGTKVKRWPLDKFEQALRGFQARWGLPVTLIGDDGERAELEGLANRIGSAKVMAGLPIAEVARVLAGARLYFGNDTGPMQLAQAHGVPGVGTFGGGHWPSYAPWGAGSIGLVSPLPCFGCDWDCIFDRGVCVENIPVEDVSRALDDVMTRRATDAESRICSCPDPRLLQIAGSAASKYWAIQNDRRKRLNTVFELSLKERRTGRTIERLETARGISDAVMESQKQLGAEFERAAKERLDALLVTDAALREARAEAGRREQRLHELEAVIETQNRRLAELDRLAAERLDALTAARQHLQRQVTVRIAGFIKKLADSWKS
ncbi:MAG TPA: glycosyltransferase family 9 protein [Terriglobales bacterium]|nr:glycosyltransferase family 9 protein [Terriglobales bacterium]